MYILFLFIIFFMFNFLLRATPKLSVDIKTLSDSLIKKSILSIYCSEVLLQKYSQLSTQYNTLEDGEGVLTLINTFLPSYNIPIFKKFFGHCPVCFWKCAAYVFCLQDANFQWLTK